MAHNMFTPEDILVRGFSYASGLKELTINDYNKATVKKFKEHYGLSPSILALIWDNIDASIKSEDDSQKGRRGQEPMAMGQCYCQVEGIKDCLARRRV